MELLTEEEAGEITKTSRWTIRRLIETGKLPALNYGNGRRKVYRIKPEDLLNVQPVEPPAPRERIRRRRRRATTLATDVYVWPPPADPVK